MLRMWVPTLLMVVAVRPPSPRYSPPGRAAPLVTQRKCTRHATRRGLHNNQLATLPAGIFDAVTSVNYLCVWGLRVGGGAAQAQVLQACVLCCAWFVAWLLMVVVGAAVRPPPPRFTPPGCAAPLATQRKCIRHATRRYLSGNQLVTLPAGIFDALTSLKYLCVWGPGVGGSAA